MQHFYHGIQGWFDFEDLYSEIVRNMPDGSRFAEVGVWKGRSLAYLAVEATNSGKNIEIHAIDTWEGSREHKNPRFHEPLLETPDGLYQHFLGNIRPVIERIRIHRMKSTEASKMFPDQHFETVFIDASHEYHDVLEDLEAWTPKVKQHSFILGHDMDRRGVYDAVKHFSEKNGLEFGLVSTRCFAVATPATE